LQSLAEAARKNEINDAITKIKDLMQTYEISIEDLSSENRAKLTKAKGTVAAQFKTLKLAKLGPGVAVPRAGLMARTRNSSASRTKPWSLTSPASRAHRRCKMLRMSSRHLVELGSLPVTVSKSPATS
jgi:hypothetical protein